MFISELAEMTGLSAHTIRFYEKLGLLTEAHTQRGPNNYRSYTPEAAQRLTLIKHGQAAGFTLNEIRELMRAWEANELTIEEKRRIVEQKLREVEAKMAELESMRGYLQAKLPLLHIEEMEALALAHPPRAK
jgi:DNA-binding transcriptional MerR regulator